MTPRSACLPAIALLALLAAAPAQPLQAQTTFTGDVVGYVPPPVSLSIVRALSFARVLPGTARTVAWNDPGAANGLVQLTGSSCAQVNVAFSALSSLTTGGQSLPIDTWTGAWTTPGTGVQTLFTPSAGGTVMQFDNSGSSVCSGSTGQYSEDVIGRINISVGATVRPAANQTPGTYAGPTLVSVTYLGM